MLTRLPSPPVVLPLLAMFGLAGTAGAQLTGEISAGSGSARFGDASPTEIFGITPAFQLNSTHFRLAARADYVEHAERGWQTSGLVSGGYQLPIIHGLKAELVGTAAWSRLSWGRAAAGALGEARLEVSGPNRGFAMSAGLGRAFPYGPSQSVTRVEARTWSRLAGLNFGLALRRTGIGVPGSVTTSSRNEFPFEDSIPNPDSPGGGSPLRRMIDHYTDFNATVGWAHQNLEIEGGFGRRFGKPVAQHTSWRIQGLYWLTERLAVVGSAGRFPNDILSGLPSGSYAMLSMRISWQDRSLATPQSRPTRASSRAGNFHATANGRGAVALGVWAPAAGRVEVMGSFNDWQALQLDSTRDGWWLAELALAPGLYEINVRFDGGPWQVPPGLTALDDGFGGSVGVFTVE